MLHSTLSTTTRRLSSNLPVARPFATILSSLPSSSSSSASSSPNLRHVSCRQQRFLTTSQPHLLPFSTSPKWQVRRIRFTFPPPPPLPPNPQDKHDYGKLPGPGRNGGGGGRGGYGKGGSGPGRGSKKQMDPRTTVTLLMIGAGGIYYIAHLEKVPETDRWRFMNVSPEFEEQFAETIRESIKSEHASRTLSPSHPISLHVQRIISRILSASSLGTLYIPHQPSRLESLLDGLFTFNSSHKPHSGLFSTESITGFKTEMDDQDNAVFGKHKKWEVIVVNDEKMVNAMASPGLIVVFTGILPVCKDEEGLAAVLSHEIGHVVARHTAERLSSQTISFSVLLILQMLGLNFGLSDLIQALVMQLPNSRKQELEADLIGLKLMSRACYDPAASPRMFERLAQLESKHAKQLSFFQTHPSSESRVKYLESHLPEAYDIFNSNPECSRIRDDFERFKKEAYGDGSGGVKAGLGAGNGSGRGFVFVGGDGEVRG